MTVAALLYTWLAGLDAADGEWITAENGALLLGTPTLSRRFQIGMLAQPEIAPRPMLIHDTELPWFGQAWSDVTLSARGVALSAADAALYLVLPSAAPQAMTALSQVAERGEDWHCVPYSVAYRQTLVAGAGRARPSPVIDQLDQLQLGRSVALPYRPLEDIRWQPVLAYLA